MRLGRGDANRQVMTDQHRHQTVAPAPRARQPHRGQVATTFGRNLRRHRLHLGISQEAFGEVLDCHRTYVGALERGELNLTLKTIERIAARLGVDALELLTAR